MTLTLDQQQRMDFLWCLFDDELIDTKDLHGDSGEALLELTARVYGNIKATSWEKTLQDMEFECEMIEQLWKETPDVEVTDVEDTVEPIPDRVTAVPIAKEIQEGLILYSCPMCDYAMFRDATRVVAHIKVAHV